MVCAAGCPVLSSSFKFEIFLEQSSSFKSFSLEFWNAITSHLMHKSTYVVNSCFETLRRLCLYQATSSDVDGISVVCTVLNIYRLRASFETRTRQNLHEKEICEHFTLHIVPTWSPPSSFSLYSGLVDQFLPGETHRYYIRAWHRLNFWRCSQHGISSCSQLGVPAYKKVDVAFLGN